MFLTGSGNGVCSNFKLKQHVFVLFVAVVDVLIVIAVVVIVIAVVIAIVVVVVVGSITAQTLTVPEFLYPFFFACFFRFMAYKKESEELVHESALIFNYHDKKVQDSLKVYVSKGKVKSVYEPKWLIRPELILVSIIALRD